ncbi:hypothetical protein UPYG_G00187560 [Umbra pygmaea]|uniref:UmuC domain-containing protein n=1 Tax=Umbra pygmaea TaxID=75934 RepID=A0ABD0WSS4_UMBPY
MDMDVEDVDEDETNWHSICVQTSQHTSVDCSNDDVPPPKRVILHFDMDCFYAQVEMIRNPALRNVPFGVQQKYIIVTCNYLARDLGVTKMMLVSEAKEKCPQLLLVKGEDLTHYREMSHKVTELLMSYCPLVERLGFDENFMDITAMVDRRMEQSSESAGCLYEGHVYSHGTCPAKVMDNPRLAVGSHIAAELRAAIHSNLGLTGCAGIATSKLLAKLVSGTFKPNQQTTLLPESVQYLVGSLSGVHKIPGVGFQTAKKLQALGIVSVQDLQHFPLAALVRDFGASPAQRIQNLALGIDDTSVTPTGPPQSLSNEDSFKKMSSTNEVCQKVEDLLSTLLDRMHKDGRQPLTFRLTIRRHPEANKWFSRESKQCPISKHIGQKITSGNGDALNQLVALAMKLFHKMVDTSKAFHLTLLNVCFSNLQASAAVSKGSIASFFRHQSPEKASSKCQGDLGLLPNRLDQSGSHVEGKMQGLTGQEESPWRPDARCSLGIHPPSYSAQPSPEASLEEGSRGGPEDTMTTTSVITLLPPNVDPDIFRLLPVDIQKELLEKANVPSTRGHQTGGSSASDPGETVNPSHHNLSKTPVSLAHNAPCKPNDSITSTAKDRKETVKGFNRQTDTPSTYRERDVPVASVQVSLPDHPEEERWCTDLRSLSQSADCGFPGNVDPTVFSELPPEVQRELLSEWRQQRPVLKIPSSSKKLSKSPLTRERKAPEKSRQANNLLNYFKPSSD